MACAAMEYDQLLIFVAVRNFLVQPGQEHSVIFAVCARISVCKTVVVDVLFNVQWWMPGVGRTPYDINTCAVQIVGQDLVQLF